MNNNLKNLCFSVGKNWANQGIPFQLCKDRTKNDSDSFAIRIRQGFLRQQYKLASNEV